MTCEQLREDGPELALGVLPARERAGAVAHLDRCADCREYVEELTLVGDRLIGLLPCAEPPVGFETRVAQALTQGTSAREGRKGREQARGSGFPRRRLWGRVRLRAAAAMAALALAFGFGGWAVGTAIEGATTGPSHPAEAGARMLWAGLTSPRVSQSTGEVFAHPGAPGWVYMTVDLADAGIPYSGAVSFQLERDDGSSVRVGSFTLHDGYGYWGGPAPVDPSALTGARLMSSDGRVLATGHFGASHQA
ncbi:anti-sigma factor family protein [Streptomyces sp. NPDC001796]|uniref:anti-sigma factor family protein n=1 Tax=Streptomyces sp. NPDC001796 TaxID=3364609 RepID=UPI0036CEE3AB